MADPITDRRQRTILRTFTWLAAGLVALPILAASQDEIVLPSGTYRLEMITASTTKIPFVGISRSASKSVSLVEIRRDGGSIMQTHRVCDFRVAEESVIKIVFPEKFIAALARPSYPVRLEKDSEGWSYRADLGVERIGYRADGGPDKLPENLQDDAVFDWDHDGHPGATLKLTVPLLPSGDLYVVQRGQSILSGRLTGPGRIEGGVEVSRFEQRVLGAKPSFLARSPQITPNPNESRFFLTPAPRESNCESLRAASTRS